MLSWADYLSIILYCILIVFLTIYLSLKNRGRSLTDFFLGNRKLHWSLLGLSMVATTFAADTPLAVTELVRKYGIAGNWLWWSFLIGGIFTATCFAHLWRRLNITTDIEFISLRYDDSSTKWLRIGKAVLYGVVFNSMIMAWVNTAMATILKHFFGLSTDIAFLSLGVILFITTLYSALSGIVGVVLIDAIQFLIAFGACVVLAYVVIYHSPIGGFQALIAKLPSEKVNFFPSFQFSKNDFTMEVFLTYLLVQWWASWYPGAEPGGGGYIAQRILSARDEKEATKATLLFNFLHYLVRPWPWIIVALATLVLYPAEDDHKATYVKAIMEYMPMGLKGLILVAFVSAYMSTISTHLNWGSSYLIRDVVQVIRKNLEEQKLVFWARVFTFLLMIVGFFLSFYIEEISGVWQLLIASGAGTGFALIMRWLWFRMNGWSEFVAMLTPPIILLVFRFGSSILPIYLHNMNLQYLSTVFITILFTVLSALLFSPPSEETINNFYLTRLGYRDKREFIMDFLRKVPIFLSYSLLFLIFLYLITILIKHNSF